MNWDDQISIYIVKYKLLTNIQLTSRVYVGEHHNTSVKDLEG